MPLANLAELCYMAELQRKLTPIYRFCGSTQKLYIPSPFTGISCTDIHHVPDENNIIRTLPVRADISRVVAKIFKAINPHRNSAAHSILHYSYFPPAACVTLYLLHLSADILQRVYRC